MTSARDILNSFRTPSQSSTMKGNIGFDNPRENIDPHVKTKVLSSQEANVSRINEVRHTKNFPSIQAAIDDLPSTGGMVFIDAGTYNISTPININVSNTTLQGENEASIINLEDNSNCAMIELSADNLSNINIIGLYLNGNKANQSAWSYYPDGSIINLSDAYGVDKVRVENCHCVNALTDGIFFDNIRDGIATGNIVENSGGNGIGCGEQTARSKRLTISNNLISGCLNGIDIEPSEETTIFGNCIYDTTNVGIVVSGTGAFNPSYYVACTSNVCHQGVGTGILFYRMKYGTINSNIVNGMSSHGVKIRDSSDIVINSNVLCELSGSAVVYINNSSDVIISSNKIVDNYSYGIQVDSTSSGATICSNDLNNNTSGAISLSGSNHLIYGNTGYNGISGSYILSGATITLTDGIITAIS